ncbi:MAG: gliding motility-associated C-terminal domain-containing protein [bacterium]|nr:gliding motility-associated C-terminal domain-containing protein [bacterium]
MKNCFKRAIVFLLCLYSTFSFAQNETKKWYFGNTAGLDFMTPTPSVLTNGAMSAFYSCSSMADAAGNLLFYTDGATVYNSSHVVMANGTGLFGNGGSNSSQGSIIIKKPGSTILYYIFTTAGAWNTTVGFNYSIVDMSLASGQGSVTVKNQNLYTGYASGRLTATRHCNGVDVWVLTKDWFYQNTNLSGTVTPNYRAYLLTSTGVNTTAVISPASTITYTNGTWYDWGCMKISPNGQKLGVANYNYNWNMLSLNPMFELYDFNNSNGVVSNQLTLVTNNISNFWWGGWGCEFSPDGTKFYGSRYYVNSDLLQWNLCAGTPSMIAASLYSITSTGQVGSLQLAANGKIYCSRWNQTDLGVINNPNASGSACNYSITGQSLSPKASWWSLPNFMSSYFIQRPPPTPFTYSVNNAFGCQTASFNTTYNPSITIVGCAASGYSLNALQWNFGDPGSGSANYSSLNSPTHAFPTLGTYTVQLVLYYSCGGGTDTLKQVVNINQPCITVSSTSITCANLGSATVAALGGTGPFSYTWMPTAQTSSVATGLSPGTYTITVFDFGNNFTYTATTVFTSLIPLTGSISMTGSVTCNGASTGTGNVTNLAGGSGSQLFFWYNGSTTLATAYTNSLSAGIWSVNVTDALTGCQINQSFFVSQPPPLSLILSANTPSACVGTTVNVSGSTSGGTPGYTYSWSTGPTNYSTNVSQAIPGIYVYTLSSLDTNACLKTNTISIDFITNPVLTVSNVSICPLKTGTLSVSGASSYTWNALSSFSTTGTSFTSSPILTTQYNVLGSALGCTSIATASIILHLLPSPAFNSNSPVCNGQQLQLYGGGGATYLWTGPLGFNAGNQFPVVNLAAPNNSGVYNLTVTTINNCTASTTASLLVNPTPALSATGSTVCSNGVFSLGANSIPGALYSWAGPLAFISPLQNPTYVSPAPNRSGIYTVTATSPVGFTNTAIAHVTVTLLPSPTAINDGPKCAGTLINFIGNGGDFYSWAGPNSFSSVQQNPTINFVQTTAGGIYTLTVTRGPCVNSTTQSLTVWALPVPTASNTGAACQTKTLQLLASTINTVTNYYWFGPFFSSTLKNPVLDSCKISYSGVYTLTVLDFHTCQASANTTVTVLQNPIVTASGATVCLNQPATLSATGAVTYFWTGPKYYQGNTANPLIPSVTIDRNGTYTVVGTAANNCTATTKVLVATKQLPVPTVTVIPNTRVCQNEVVTLNGGGGQSYTWYGPNDIMYEGSIVTFTAGTNWYGGTYTLIVSDGIGCSNFTTTPLYIEQLPSGSLAGILEGCAPLCSDYRFSSNGLGGSFIQSSWQINKQIIGSENFYYCFDRAGTFTINGSLFDTKTACTNLVDFEVTVHPKPEADFQYSPLKPVEKLDEVFFTNTSRGEQQKQWTWFFDNNKGNKERTENTSHLYPDAGQFPVVLVVRNKWGCTDTLMKVIIVEPDFAIYVPNAFTPNEDERNEVFMPVIRSAKNYNIKIYDRWGEQIFESSDLLKGWDGTYKGASCKQDVYNWKIVVSAANGEQRILTGSVLLMR